MKRYLSKLLSEVLGSMFDNGQISALPSFNFDIPRENFGDYSTNVAMIIAREGKFQPNDVADIIARGMQELDKAGKNIIEEVKVVSGFVNIYLSKQAIAENVLNLTEEVKIDQFGVSKKVVFEYSSPNTNKPLHIGHTRNDVFGMACINLLRATGHSVVSCEVINDRGIHIMKSMLMYSKYGNGETPESAVLKPDHFIGKYYQMFASENAKFEALKKTELEQTSLEKEAQDLLQKWEAGDEQVRELWQKMNDWYYQGVKQTYKREGSEFDSVEHESDMYDKGRDLVLEGVKKGVFHKDETGAVYVDLTEQGLDKKYLLRKDGTTIYITQDMYLWYLRDQKYHPDAAIVVTAAEQIYHFAVLKKIFELLEFPWAQSFQHLPYGFVFLGKNKISSREGKSVSADELLEITKERVAETMRNSLKIKGSADDDVLLETVAFGAIKYGYLKFDPNTQIYFDLEETVAIEGNTGPYLQYTYARIKSILSKAGDVVREAPLGLSEKTELALARHLMHYDEAVVKAARDFRPTAVCSYLFELASKFNSFYDQVSVLQAETEKQKQQRLVLLLSVANVLQHGLALLGIKTVEQM
ncbi:MAG: arginine--tRNA ligase [Patescibacteria group bacterium]